MGALIGAFMGLGTYLLFKWMLESEDEVDFMDD